MRGSEPEEKARGTGAWRQSWTHRLVERERDDVAELLGRKQADLADTALGDHEYVVERSVLVVWKLRHGPEVDRKIGHAWRGFERAYDLREVHAVVIPGLAGARGARPADERARLQDGLASGCGRQRDFAKAVGDHDHAGRPGVKDAVDVRRADLDH